MFISIMGAGNQSGVVDFEENWCGQVGNVCLGDCRNHWMFKCQVGLMRGFQSSFMTNLPCFFMDGGTTSTPGITNELVDVFMSLLLGMLMVKQTTRKLGVKSEVGAKVV